MSIKILFLKLKRLFSELKFIDLLIFISLIIGTFSIISYYQKEKKSLPRYGGIYREGLYGNPIENLNPLELKNENEETIINIIYPPLIEFDNGKLISRFINSYNLSKDKLTLTLTLKNNLKWSNGNPLTVEDFVSSFEIFKKNPNSKLYPFIKDVELRSLDSYQLEIKLKNADNLFFFNLVNFRILPTKLLLSNEFTNFNSKNLEIGSGPFVLEKLEKINEITVITLQKNIFYQPQPYLDKIIFYVFPSPKKAFDALLTKQIDGLAGLNYLDLPQIIINNYNLNKIILPRIIGIFFNTKNIKPEIVNYLNQNIDRREIVSYVFKGYAEETEAIFSPTIRQIFKINNPNGKAEHQATTTKLERKVKIITSDTYLYPEIGRYFQEKKLFDVEFLPQVDLIEKIKSKDYQGIIYGLNYGQPPLLHYFFSKMGYNINNFDEINLEKSFQQLMTDPSININEKIAEIEKKIISSNSNIFLLNPYYLYLINKKIVGFDQKYLLKPELRFTKVERWYREK